MPNFAPVGHFGDIPDNDHEQNLVNMAPGTTSLTAGDAAQIDPTTTTHGLGRHVRRSVAGGTDPAATGKCIGVIKNTRAASSTDPVEVAQRGTVQRDANVATGAVQGDLLILGPTAGRFVPWLGIIVQLVAAGTSLTASTTETLLAPSGVIPASAMAAGKRYRFRGYARVTAQAGATTTIVRVRIGPTTLTGTAVAGSTAVDAVVGMVYMVEGVIECRTSGQVVQGSHNVLAAEGGAMLGFQEILSLTTTVANRVEFTAEHSANDATAVEAESWVFEEIPNGPPIALCLEDAAANVADIYIL